MLTVLFGLHNGVSVWNQRYYWSICTQNTGWSIGTQNTGWSICTQNTGWSICTQKIGWSICTCKLKAGTIVSRIQARAFVPRTQAGAVVPSRLDQLYPEYRLEQLYPEYRLEKLCPEYRLVQAVVSRIQGEAAFLGQTLGLCCERGKGIIVGSSSLTCSPGGKNHISVSQRPPLAKMWRQEQFRCVIVHGLRAGIYNTVCDT